MMAAVEGRVQPGTELKMINEKGIECTGREGCLQFSATEVYKIV